MAKRIFDSLIVEDSESRKPIVILASQPYYSGAFRSKHARKEMIFALARTSVKFPDARFFIKPHPMEDVSELNEVVSGTQIAILGQDIDIVDCVRSANIVVTFFSTVGLQALLTGKDLVTLDFPGAFDAEIYRKSGASWICQSEIEIESVLRRLIHEPNSQLCVERRRAGMNFIGHCLTANKESKATDRIISLLIKADKK